MSSLTTAELRLLPLLSTHLTFREIGERLYVSEHRVVSSRCSPRSSRGWRCSSCGSPRPERVDAAFSTWLWPLLGIIFLPFATLIYLLLYTPGRGLSGWEWFWVVLAAILDIGHWGASDHPAQPDPGLARLRGLSAGWPVSAAADGFLVVVSGVQEWLFTDLPQALRP